MLSMSSRIISISTKIHSASSNWRRCTSGTGPNLPREGRPQRQLRRRQRQSHLHPRARLCVERARPLPPRLLLPPPHWFAKINEYQQSSKLCQICISGNPCEDYGVIVALPDGNEDRMCNQGKIQHLIITFVNGKC